MKRVSTDLRDADAEQDVTVTPSAESATIAARDDASALSRLAPTEDGHKSAPIRVVCVFSGGAGPL